MPQEPPKREQVYGVDDIAVILKQIALKQIRATIELRHDGSGKDLFTFYFTKINAADIALKG
jgi:hypothetical protein